MGGRHPLGEGGGGGEEAEEEKEEEAVNRKKDGEKRKEESALKRVGEGGVAQGKPRSKEFQIRRPMFR